MRALQLLAIAVFSSTVAAQTVVPVGSFRSIELRHGGHVTVRHGATQRVTILSGDARYSRIFVENGQLVIEKCNPDCPRGYRHQIEVVTPELSAASVSNGGTLQSVGEFPSHRAIEARVEQGGTVDIRSIPADHIDASVESGGGIFITPHETLTATIQSGGVITYFGNARVKSSVRDGGVVKRGTAAEAAKPLSRGAH